MRGARRQCRGDRVARRGDARADRVPATAGSRPTSTAAACRAGCSRRRASPRRVARIDAALPGASSSLPSGGTTHVSVVDADGNAVSVTSSTGSGSGVIVPGTGFHLNNMLGEYDLAGAGAATPGRRLTSMMSPTVVVGDGGPRLVVGSAGSVRLRGAIMQVIANVVAHGDGVAEAIDRPRVHVDEPHVHCEGGFDPAVLDRLEEIGLRRRPLAPAQPLLRRHERGRGASRRPPRRGGRRAPRRCRDRRRPLTLARSGLGAGVERGDLAVLAGALVQRPLQLDGFDRELEQLREPADAPARRGRCQELLLLLGAELDACGECEVEVRRALPTAARRRCRSRPRAARTARARARPPRRRADRRRRRRAPRAPVVNERPRVSSSSRNRSRPSTMMFELPSSSVSRTSTTAARVPISCTAPSPVASTRPNSPSEETHSSISSR